MREGLSKTIRDLPFKRKLTILTMLTCCVALFLSTTLFIVYELVSFRRALVEKIDTLANVTGNNVVAALSFIDPQSAEVTLTALRAEPHIVSACIFDRKGQLFARYAKKRCPSCFIQRRIRPLFPRGKFPGESRP